MSCGRWDLITGTSSVKMKSLKCGTKTCGLAEEEQGWVSVNKLKANKFTKMNYFHLQISTCAWALKFHMYIFPYENVKCV